MVANVSSNPAVKKQVLMWLHFTLRQQQKTCVHNIWHIASLQVSWLAVLNVSSSLSDSAGRPRQLRAASGNMLLIGSSAFCLTWSWTT